MMVKRIAVLTSGGDAPGMNAALSAIFHTVNNQKGKWELFLIKDGFKGLCEGEFEKATFSKMSRINDKAGSIIGSSRYEKLKEEKYLQQAIKNLQTYEISGLIVIGGNGSYIGAKRISEYGIKCIALPGTIDNDIPGTQFSIGFDSCVNEVVNAIDNLRFTADSHQRCIVVEVMGRHCSQIAHYAQLATNCEIFSTPDIKLTSEEIINHIKNIDLQEKKSIIVLVSEKLYDVHHLSSRIEEETGIITRGMVLSFLQRGAKPSAYDRKIASLLGMKAVKELINGHSGMAIS
jgi:6-phosphofructokinase 1